MVALVDRIIGDTGRIDVLVNNAGYGSYGSLEDVPMDEARRQVEINVFALARLTQLALPHMRARRSGYVVNVSSMGGKFGEPLGSWYHATKYAVEGLSDSIRPELAPFGIHVVVIEPGAIRTEWGGIAAGEPARHLGQRPVRGAGRADRQGARPAGEHPDRRRRRRWSRTRSPRPSPPAARGPGTRSAPAPSRPMLMAALRCRTG